MARLSKPFPMTVDDRAESVDHVSRVRIDLRCVTFNQGSGELLDCLPRHVTDGGQFSVRILAPEQRGCLLPSLIRTRKAVPKPWLIGVLVDNFVLNSSEGLPSRILGKECVRIGWHGELNGPAFAVPADSEEIGRDEIL